MNLIVFREENIDGCGDFADVLVNVKQPVTEQDKEALMAKLNEFKRQMREEDACYDTDEMVQWACDEVFGTSNWEEAGVSFLTF